MTFIYLDDRGEVMSEFAVKRPWTMNEDVRAIMLTLSPFSVIPLADILKRPLLRYCPSIEGDPVMLFLCV